MMGVRRNALKSVARSSGIGETIGPHDLQIAAVALQHNLTLVTHNTREFARISTLRLDDWEL